MNQLKENLAQLEEAVAELNEAVKFKNVTFKGTDLKVKGGKRPEVKLRSAARRGKVKPSTIEKHLGDKGQWVTINGVHVLINKDTGEPIIGPRDLTSQRKAGQRNLDKVMGGKKHGFEVQENEGKGRDEKGRFTMKHKPSGMDIPLSGVGLGSVLLGLAMFVDAAKALAVKAGAALADKLEGAIRQADEALGMWTID